MRIPLLGLLALSLAACDGGREATAPANDNPPPTEHVIGPDAEADQKRRREAWIEQIHEAPPDVDWQAIERGNGLAQIAKRNRLASLPETYDRWAERGSDNQAGRMHVAAISTDGTTLYAGSSLGGLWKGNLDGTEWTPIGDNLYGGVHWLVAVPGADAGSPDKLIAATDGGMIHMTRDEGRTWEVPTGLSGVSSEVRRLLTTSDGSHTVFLHAKGGGLYRVYRSTNHGETFQLIHTTYGRGDLWVPRNGGNDVYLAVNGNLKKSTDLGNTWTTVGTLPTGPVQLTGSEAGAPRLWAIVENGTREVHRSDNAGATWTWVTNITDYWGSLSASIVDVDAFAYGGVEVHRTYDAGSTWSIVNSWGAYYSNKKYRLHADIPGIDVFAFGPNGETWYIATDGGLYHSEDTLQTVLNLSLHGLRVSQYYSTLTSAADPNHVAAGSQDQGYQWASSPPASGTALDFTQVISGDYGHLTSGDGTHAYVFSVYPGFVLVHRNEANPILHTVNFPAGESYSWMPPVFADPADPEDFFFCAKKLYRYEKHSSNYSWTPSPYSSHDFSAVSGGYLSAFRISPVDPNRAYAATGNGHLFWSNDGGLSWTESASIGPNAHYFYGLALLPSATDVDTVYVGGNGYGVPSVYRSTDGGQTFHAWSDGLPDTLVYCLGEQPDGTGTIYAGTETSAYRREPGASAWEDITGNDAPITIYWSVEALPHENTMRFGTYGRGIWDYRLEPPASYETFGCGVNPAGSLVVFWGDQPVIGTTMHLGLSNPLGAMNAGAFSFGFFSLEPDPSYPCGTLLPGFGMAGSGAAGELLIGVVPPDPSVTLVGGTWGGPGQYAPLDLPIPNDPDLLGLVVYGQGLLLDPTMPTNKLGLTEGIELVLGR